MRKHTPVLFQETLDALPEQCRVVMDGTLGHGGHTVGMVKSMLDEKKDSPLAPLKEGGSPLVTGVDRDEAMITKAKHFMQEEGVLEYVTIVQGSYAELTKIGQQSGVEKFDAILLDIGVNMDHFKEADRGFSIKLDGELDMRYDRSIGIPASQLLDTITYDNFCMMLEKWTDFGQTYREKIAKSFIGVRKRVPFTTTQEVRTWAKEIGIGDKKLAVLFQAIRIETNNELGELENFLQSFTDFLISGGRCIIITYHSIEDRLVKYAFKSLVEANEGRLVNKKVIKPHRQEVKKNKAARSAKLRIFEKI